MCWAVGMGRLGAIVGPALVGVLADKGWQASSLYGLSALPFLVAVLPVNVIARTISRRTSKRGIDAVEA